MEKELTPRRIRSGARWTQDTVLRHQLRLSSEYSCKYLFCLIHFDINESGRMSAGRAPRDIQFFRQTLMEAVTTDAIQDDPDSIERLQEDNRSSTAGSQTNSAITWHPCWLWHSFTTATSMRSRPPTLIRQMPSHTHKDRLYVALHARSGRPKMPRKEDTQVQLTQTNISSLRETLNLTTIQLPLGLSHRPQDRIQIHKMAALRSEKPPESRRHLGVAFQ